MIRVMVNMQSLSDRSSRSKYRLVLTLIFLSLFTLVFALFVYAFLHEAGHALTGFLFGQKLSGFHIDLLTWDAHVGMVGRLTQSQRAIVLHGEGYRVDRDGGLWAKNLPPGLYQLVLTSHQSSGSASVYVKTP